MDSFRPKGGQARNLTFRLTYRAADKTLRDSDVDKAHGLVLGKLAEALPVKQQ